MSYLEVRLTARLTGNILLVQLQVVTRLIHVTAIGNLALIAISVPDLKSLVE